MGNQAFAIQIVAFFKEQRYETILNAKENLPSCLANVVTTVRVEPHVLLQLSRIGVVFVVVVAVCLGWSSAPVS